MHWYTSVVFEASKGDFHFGTVLLHGSFTFSERLLVLNINQGNSFGAFLGERSGDSISHCKMCLLTVVLDLLF